MTIFYSDSAKIKLIHAIKLHPCLYDTRLESYHERRIRNRAWDEIAQQCGFPGQTEACRVAWKRLKEKYKRKKVQFAAHSVDESARPSYWGLYQLMTFIEPFFQTRRSRNKDPSDIEEVKEALQDSPLKQDEIMPEASLAFKASDTLSLSSSPGGHVAVELLEVLSNTSGSSEVNHKKYKRKANGLKQKRLKSKEDDELIKNILQNIKSTDSQSKDVFNDPISLFYLSMAEEARRLSPIKRLRLQSQIIDITTKAFEDTS